MKAVILAGGLGTRMSEETVLRPKPMVEIGGRPILWHIMKLYGHHGVGDFIICLGYKGYMIKEYFANYFLHNSNVTFDLKRNAMTVHESSAEPWTVTLVDTGTHTMTGGRVKRVAPYVGNEAFLLTYGDGIGDVDVRGSIAFHQSSGRVLTLTATQPPGRFGQLNIRDDSGVSSFMEKPRGDGGWINGGFFVCEPKLFAYIDGDQTVLEEDPLRRLVADDQLAAYKHYGFWRPMDTLRDRAALEELWQADRAPWKTWT
ncbi:MAG: glucose-1-phosphate cytidylyltransferase [Proteobacteria bacterium]|nr:glucose-1-phosphate cytidylyltransferase [Pseudomonadota bacterium]